MYATLSGLIAVIFYSLGSFYQSRSLASGREQRRKVLACGIVAVVTHLLNVYWLIFTPEGLDFGFFKMATLFSWTIAVIVLLSSLRKPLENLFLALFPLAVVSIILSVSLSSDYTPQSTWSGGEVTHILLAVVATSIITIAAVQAVFLAYQNHQLKHHHLGFVRRMPPLQTMESLLFQILWIGLLMLSAVIVSGFIFMDDMFAQDLAHKTILSIVAWVVFAVLLWGRHQLGWRGNTAIRWTLAGFFFLVLAYFGSKFVLELILHRA